MERPTAAKDGGKTRWLYPAPQEESLPPEVANAPRAEGPKYRKLLKTLAVEADRQTYGDFYDYGYWSGSEWQGHRGLPPGYWVYVAPNWYIFAEAQQGPGLAGQGLSAAGQAKRPWGPEPACGPPDPAAAGDCATAWASATADGQDEWLRLYYERTVVPSAVHVYETFNPGALYRITARTADGRDVEIWSGDDPLPQNSGKGVAMLPVKAGFATKCITIYLKSTKVPGWNEIDAVGLLDAQEKVQWAVSAEASSTYADVGVECGDFPRRVYGTDYELRIARLEEQVRRLDGEVREVRLREQVKNLENEVRVLHGRLEKRQKERD